MVIVIILVIFMVSFILAYRQLSELTIPKEIKDVVAAFKKKSQVWGIIVFLKDKINHYSSWSSSSVKDNRSSSEIEKGG